MSVIYQTKDPHLGEMAASARGGIALEFKKRSETGVVVACILGDNSDPGRRIPT
jgi:hypothetical protein